MNENIDEMNEIKKEDFIKEFNNFTNNFTWDELAEKELNKNSHGSNSKVSQCSNEVTSVQSQIRHISFVQGAEWQRKQLLHENIIEEAARAAHKNDVESGFVAHSWGQNPEIDNSYRSNAKAAIQAILHVKKEQAQNIQKMQEFEDEIGEPL